MTTVQPCVWMAAGLVRYRLCDRDFDCGNCPLDLALRGRGAAGGESDLPFSEPTFPDDRHYHRAHMWVLSLGPGRVRIGVDALVTSVLPRPTAVVLPARGSVLSAGRSGAWLVTSIGIVPLVAPVDGAVCARNAAVLEHPSTAFVAPYDDGWLLEIEAPGPHPDLLDRDGVARRTERQLGRLRRRVQSRIGSTALAVGPTLADGGTPVEELWRIVAPERYLRLLLPLLR